MIIFSNLNYVVENYDTNENIILNEGYQMMPNYLALFFGLKKGLQ